MNSQLLTSAKANLNAFLGIHLAGPNSEKTTIAAAQKNAYSQYVITDIYEKIGSFGDLFSDDRLVDLIRYIGPYPVLFLDAPLSSPPCVSCVRSTCPGVVGCADLSVAYMLSINGKLRAKRKSKKIWR